jgi:hypothetical protein
MAGLRVELLKVEATLMRDDGEGGKDIAELSRPHVLLLQFPGSAVQADPSLILG